MTKEEVLLTIELFKAKSRDAKDLDSITTSVMDTDVVCYKIYNGDECVASFSYTDYPRVDVFMVELWIGYGHYFCDNFEIAKILIEFVKY